MKKRVLMLLGAAVMALSLGACKDKKSSEPDQQQNVQQTFTVAFEVDGVRVATARVKDGEKVTQQIDDPVKTGYVFLGWYEGETKVDLATYVVTKNVTLVAKFEEFHVPEYNINETKDNSRTYYLVVGWWECTDYEKDTETGEYKLDENGNRIPKLTSHLTPETVRLFYYNLRNYLTTVGATEENLNAITFRNYSSGPVADMGAAINADGDVDLIIGVGNNINSTAGVALYNSSNDYKFQTEMGDPLTPRHVACPSFASELGVSTFEWLKETTAGKNSFKKVLTQAEIDASITIDLTVTVHGDEPAVTHLDDKDDVIQMPTITVPDDKLFKGFATSEGGTVVLNVAKDAELKYKDVKNLIVEGAKTLDLYPVLDDKPQYDEDLMVFIQAGAMTEVEEKLLEARFNYTLGEEHVNYTVVSGDAAAYTAAVGTYADVLIGTNELLSAFTADSTGALASAGAKHFAGAEAFKVMISEHVVDEHKTLAQSFYNFVVAEAAAFDFHYTYWHNNNSWVTEAERALMDTGIEAEVKAALGITGSETLQDKYNVSITKYVATKTKVAELGTETRELRNNKGTDLIIGCGSNVDETEPGKTTGGMTTIAKKTLGRPFVAASSRYTALIHENPMARAVYENYLSYALSVTVHGDNNQTTVLDDADDVVTMPTITEPANHTFEGFALTESGPVALDIAKDATLKIADLLTFVNANTRTLDLYPVFAEIPSGINLTVTVHGVTNVVTTLDDANDVVSMPEINIPDGKLFKGFATSEGGAVVISHNKYPKLNYSDLETLVEENATTLDLYPIVGDSDLIVLIQVNGTNLTNEEADLLEARFNASLTGQRVKFTKVDGDASAFTTEVTNAEHVDVIIGGNNPLKNFAAYGDYTIDNTGDYHFVKTGSETNRKVLVSSKVVSEHVELAATLYNFAKTAAPKMQLSYAYWSGWVAEDEMDAMDLAIESYVATLMGLEDTSTLSTSYNIECVSSEVAENETATAGAATNATNASLIIGCGDDVTSVGGVQVLAKKQVASSFMANERYVALLKDNLLAKAVYTNYFNS